jgi:hypothetical protein
MENNKPTAVDNLRYHLRQAITDVLAMADQFRQNPETQLAAAQLEAWGASWLDAGDDNDRVDGYPRWWSGYENEEQKP